MYIIIIGAGAVGAHLARSFSRDGHDVAVIEKDPAANQSLGIGFDGLIIQGDGTHLGSLEDAGIKKAECLAAVTGNDKDNMIICGLAKKHFNVPRTIGRVNDPANEKVFQSMGVDFPVSATSIIARAIENESVLVKEMTLLTMKDGDMKLVKFKIENGNPLVGKCLREITMPPDARVSILERSNETCIPRGDTSISEGDFLYVILKSHAEEATRGLILGSRGGRMPLNGTKAREQAEMKGTI